MSKVEKITGRFNKYEKSWFAVNLDSFIEANSFLDEA